MIEKLVIYPCTKETAVIARFPDLIPNFQLCKMVAPKGWNLEGKDTCYFDGGEETGILMTEDFQQEVQGADAVLFLDNHVNITAATYMKKIEQAHENKKKVLLSKCVKEKLNVCGYDTEGLATLTMKQMTYEEIGSLNSSRTIYPINVPVLVIYGLGEECNKFAVQLGLRRLFMEQGYRVLQLGTKEYASLFGFCAMPDFLYRTDLALAEKIIALNHYLHHLEISNQPDIIILGVPGAIMPLHKEITCRFGEYAYIIGNAVEADLGVLCMNEKEEIQPELLEYYKMYCQCALHTPVEYYGMSHYVWSYDEVMQRELELTVDHTRVQQNVSKIQNQVNPDEFFLFDCLDIKQIQEAYCSMIDRL